MPFNDTYYVEYAPAEKLGVSVEIGRGSGCIILSALVSTYGPDGEGQESWYETKSYYGYTMAESLERYLEHLDNKALKISEGDDD
jgi:hypothetical protein